MKKIMVSLLAISMIFASVACNVNGPDSSSGTSGGTGSGVENGGDTGTGSGGSGIGSGDNSEEIGVNEPGKVIKLVEKSSPKAQYTLPVNLPNLKMGDIVELKMKGTSDRIIENLYIKFVDDDSNFLWLADQYSTVVDDEFDIMWSYEVTTFPKSSGKKRTCFNFMDIMSPTPATLTCEEFIIDVVDKTTFEGRWVTKESDGDDNYWLVIDDNKVTVGTDDYDDWPYSMGSFAYEINGTTLKVPNMNMEINIDNGKFSISDPGNPDRNITFIKISNRAELPSETTILSNYMNQSYYNRPSSTVYPADYVGTWTGTMGPVSLSITINADGTISAYNSMEGETTGFWTVTNSGFIMWLYIGDECPEEGLPGNLQGDKLEVNYMGNEISLTKE